MRIVAGLLSLSRVVVGIGLIARPESARMWIGRQAKLPGAQVMARCFGARDVVLGLGTLRSLARNDGSASTWMVAQAIGEGSDIAAARAAGRRIPRRGRMLVYAMAGTAGTIALVTAGGLRRGARTSPAAPPVEQVTEAGAVPTEPVGTA